MEEIKKTQNMIEEEEGTCRGQKDKEDEER